MALPDPKASDTPNYTGVPSPSPNDAGTLQTGGWANNLTSPPWWDVPNEVYEALPACVRVQLSGSGIEQIGPNQYQMTLSLSGGDTIQLNPNGADAQQNPTSAVAPNVFTWTFTSRNVHVVTVDSSGLVSAVGRGEAEVVIQTPRQVNASIAGATPSGTEGVQASLVVRVLA